jgi:hypothetical protein
LNEKAQMVNVWATKRKGAAPWENRTFHTLTAKIITIGHPTWEQTGNLTFHCPALTNYFGLLRDGGMIC